MQVLVSLVIGSFLIGGTPVGRWIRDRPVALLVVATCASALFYSLRVVL